MTAPDATNKPESYYTNFYRSGASCKTFSPVVSPPSSGGLLTLNAVNSGVQGYQYFDVENDFLGAFRLPDGNNGPNDWDNFKYNDDPVIALNGPNKIFMRGQYGGGNYAGIGEINIPSTLSASTNIADLPIATYTAQEFDWPYPNLDEVSGFDDSGGNGMQIGGMCVVNGKLVGTIYWKYVSNTPMAPIFVYESVTLDSSNARGMWASSSIDGSHFAGWISPIPAEWQAQLQGSHIFGMSQGDGRSLNNRGSNGPSLFTYDFNNANSITSASPPADLSELALNRLMDFPVGGLAIDPSQNNFYSTTPDPAERWTNMSEAYFGFIVPGSKTYAVFGFSAGHQSGTHYPGGSSGFEPGDHADSYSYYWLFNVEDIIAASSPAAPRPYEYGPFDNQHWAGGFPPVGEVRGGAYDPDNKKLYLVVHDAEGAGVRGINTSLSVINVYDLSGIAS